MVQKTTTRRAPRTRRGGLLGAAAGLALALGGLIAGAPAQAHDQLVSADPGVNATVQQAPDHVSLRFSADITPVGNEIRVTDSHGKTVSTGDASVSGNTVTEKITPDSGDETYTVTWRVVSSDGHPVQGTFGFVVGQGGSGEHTALPSQPAHHDDDDDDHAAATGTSSAAPAETPSAASTSQQQAQNESSGMPLVLVGVIGAVVALVVVGLVALLVARARDRRNGTGDRGSRGEK